MPALTAAQRADCYFFCGWPQRYVQVNTALEWALDAIAGKPEMQAIVGNLITASPSGLLAQLRLLYDVTIPAAYRRLKALKVGSIELSGNGELMALAAQGQRLVNSLCAVLGVGRDVDVFRPGSGSQTPGMGGWGSRGYGDNWIGK